MEFPPAVAADYDETSMRARSRRVLLLFAVVLLAGIAVATAIYLRGNKPSDDCETIHQMNSYNKSFNESAGKSSDADIDQYRTWATELRHYADKVGNPELRAKAESLADLADRYVALTPQMKTDLGASGTSGPGGIRPAWVSEMEQISKEFNTAVVNLAAYCP